MITLVHYGVVGNVRRSGIKAGDVLLQGSGSMVWLENTTHSTAYHMLAVQRDRGITVSIE